MFNVGGGEVLVILLIALIVLGPDKLPNAARQAGKYLGDFRRMSHGFQRELRDAMDLGDLGELGDLIPGGSKSKPKSAGGPTSQQPAAATTISPSADATPTDATPTDGTAVTGSETPSVNGSSASSDGTVTKRSIVVDGPSTSFD